MRKFNYNIIAIALLTLPFTAIGAQKSETKVDDGLEYFRTHNLSQSSNGARVNIVDANRLPFGNGDSPEGDEIGISDPEGTKMPLVWKGHTYTGLQEVSFCGYGGEIVKSKDGKTLYFYNILPDYQTYWLKGEIDADKNVVVIQNDQLLYEEANNKYYFVGMICELDDYGYAVRPTANEIAKCPSFVEIPLTEDGGIDATGFFFWLWGYADINYDYQGNPMTTDAYISYSYSMVGHIMNEQIIQVPDDAEEADYFFTEDDIYYGVEWADTYGYMGNVKIKGDDVYMRGLCSLTPRSYVYAKREGNVVKMPSNQVLTDGRFYYTFNGISNLREEEVSANGYTWTETVYDIVDEVPFDVNEDSYVLQLAYGVEGDFLGSDKTRPYWYVNLTLKKYAGNKAAKPCAVENLNYSEWWEYNFCDFNFYFICQDAETGEWINPNNCFYEVYFDDKPYTFTADRHTLKDGDTEMTKVPVLYKTADFRAYDEFSMYQGESMYFTMHDKDMKWERMKMRIGYTDDEGVTHYSDFNGVHNKSLTVEDVAVDVTDFKLTNEDAVIAANAPVKLEMIAHCGAGSFYGPMYIEVRDADDALVATFVSEPIDLDKDQSVKVEVTDGFAARSANQSYQATVWTFVDCKYVKVCDEEVTFNTSDSTGINGLTNDVKYIEYFDLQGHQLQAKPSMPGVYIKAVTRANGARSISKILIK